jgi:hypothetical protein
LPLSPDSGCNSAGFRRLPPASEGKKTGGKRLLRSQKTVYPRAQPAVWPERTCLLVNTYVHS